MSNWERQLEKINLKTADNEMLDFKRKSARIYKNLFKNTEEELLKLLEEIEENPTRSTLYEYKKYYEFRNKLIAQLDSLGVKINSSMTSNLENTYKKVQSNVNNLLPNAKEVPDVPLEKVTEVISKDWVGDGKNYSMRIWKDKDRLLGAIEEGLNECLVRGDSKDKFVEQLMNNFNTGYYNSNRLARTEIIRTMNQSTLDRYSQAGITKVKVVTKIDDRTCDKCKAQNGKVFDLDKIKTSDYMLHPNCRCTIVPIV